ncbi:MAG TPA: hypothetical protein VGR02_09125 [Thermoanaerobaculia bacterium]|jgi:hypothetical protein|nr:hypothetical protein [Thermoanaerobaculia bacterium]
MNRWTVILGALLLAVVVGGIAYNAGVTQGMVQSGKIVTVAPPAGAYPYAYPYPYYGWHRPWGLGFFFAPLFFIFFWFIVVRGLFGRYRGCNGGTRFEEWHRRMHERMETPQP